MKCPRCGKELNIHYKELDQIDEKCVNYFAAHCLYCHKTYEWEEIYVLSEITSLTETED